MLAFCLIFGIISDCSFSPVPVSAGESAAEENTSGDMALSGDSEQTAETVEEGFLRIGFTTPCATMDIHKTQQEYMIPLNIYERLFDIQVREDGSSELIYGLAEDWSVSPDGLVYSFTLRDDAYFCDGTPVTAYDAAFTFTRMLTLKDSVQTDFGDMILGADELIAGQTDHLEGVRVLDERHLQITLSEPFSGYLYLLATPSCSILSEACVKANGALFGNSAESTIGSGPYMVTEYTKDRITLERNPYYHCREGEELSVTKAQILVLPPAIMDQTFQNGGLDILDANIINPDLVENVYKSGKWKDRIISRQRVDVQYLMMNLNTPPLNDVRIRKAVQMAIDRQEILNTVYSGDGSLTDGIFPEGLIGYNEENQGWLQYNPDEARRLIREAGNASEVCLELAVDSADSVRNLTVMEMIRQDLSEAGLNVSIVSYDADSLLYLRKAGLLMAYSNNWSADYNDPDNFIYTFFGNREKTLYRSGNFDNQEVFDRITKARAIQNEADRLAEYSALEALLIQDEAVWVPLFSTDHLYVLGDRVESFTPFWAGWSSMYFRDVVMKEAKP